MYYISQLNRQLVVVIDKVQCRFSDKTIFDMTQVVVQHRSRAEMTADVASYMCAHWDKHINVSTCHTSRSAVIDSDRSATLHAICCTMCSGKTPADATC